MDMENKVVLIKESSFITDDHVYNLLKFNKNYLPESRKEELLAEYRLGKKLDDMGLTIEEFDTFEKYLNILYEIYMDEKGAYTWKSDENWCVVDIDRQDSLLSLATLYNEIYIDGRKLDKVEDDILVKNLGDGDFRYAVVYMEKE